MAKETETKSEVGQDDIQQIEDVLESLLMGVRSTKLLRSVEPGYRMAKATLRRIVVTRDAGGA